mmetsp:Transcript_1986/g.4997  ORF Transcript_1986/g.4997 Transcript_1986/m.4997 type:complete len:110 (+) Transcript_1986:201-530(+)
MSQPHGLWLRSPFEQASIDERIAPDQDARAEDLLACRTSAVGTYVDWLDAIDLPAWLVDVVSDLGGDTKRKVMAMLGERGKAQEWVNGGIDPPVPSTQNERQASEVNEI